MQTSARKSARFQTSWTHDSYGDQTGHVGLFTYDCSNIRINLRLRKLIPDQYHKVYRLVIFFNGTIFHICIKLPYLWKSPKPTAVDQENMYF